MPASTLLRAVPVLAAPDIEQAAQLLEQHFGFTRVFLENESAEVSRDEVKLHLWSCSDRTIIDNTSCRIEVSGIDELYESGKAAGVLHPNGHLEKKPWGSHEFTILLPDASAITFVEW
jgi:hypothetical protein